jgi:hypothetical protein
LDNRKEQGSVFDSLVQNLSERERKEFLRKIRSNMNMDDSRDERRYGHQTDDEERTVWIKRDLRKLSPFYHIVFFFLGIFTGRTREELLYRHKMKELKKRINRRAPGIVGFDTRSLKKKCPELVYELYLSVLPVSDFFRSIWGDGENSIKLQEFFFRLVDKNLQAEQDDVFTFFPFEEIVKEYKRRGSKEDLLAELDKRVDKFVGAISKKHFELVENVVRPIYLMKDLVLFPYKNFFNHFHGALRPEEPERVPLFQSTSVIASLEELEDLYYALYNASKADVTGEISNDWVREVFSEVMNSSAEEEPEEEPEEKEEEKEEPDVDAEREEEMTYGVIIDELKDLSHAIKTKMKQLPLPEIIRYFREDPYYRLVVYMPSFDVVSFYRYIKKMRLHLQLEEKIERIIEQAMEEERESLFVGCMLKELKHYRLYSRLDYHQIGVPPFAYQRALFVLYNYLLIFYKSDVQKILQICEQIIPAQDRITRDRIVRHAANAEEVLDKIELLDESLAEEQEEGRAFNRMRMQSTFDVDQRRILRTLVIKKDREAKELTERGGEAMAGLKKIFTELLEANDRQIQESIGKRYLFRGRPMELKAKIEETIRKISNLEQMLGQYAKIRAERGTDQSPR